MCRFMCLAVLFMAPMLSGCATTANLTGDIAAGAAVDMDAWNTYVPEHAAGQVRYEVDAAAEGKALHIAVDPAAKSEWYQYHLDLPIAEPGAVYELNAWAKAEGIANGVGAGISISIVDAEPPHERIAAGDSERLHGDKPWSRLRGAIFVPEGVNTLRLMLMLNGTGEAWFRDVRVRRVSRQPAAADGGEIMVRVGGPQPVRPFIGFGVEDDAFFYTDENFRHGITPEDVALRNERIAELNPSVVATLFWWDAFDPDQDLENITYDTELMRALYRTLEVHQKAGREVFLGDVFWGRPNAVYPYSDANVEKGIVLYAGLIEHLVKEKGLTCVRNVCVAGEVDLVFEQHGGSFDSYLKANKLLREELDQRGLENVRVIGDKSGGFVWFRRALGAIEDRFGVFTLHEYPDPGQYPIIYDRLRHAKSIIREYSDPVEHTPAGPVHKPAFLYEIGFVRQRGADPMKMGAEMPSYEYGLLCANSSIAALREGFAGGSVWCLHSMYYPFQNLMDFGIWEWKDQDWRLRPVYYAYGMFTRFARAGMRPLNITLSPDPYDAGAAAVLDGKGNAVFYAVNIAAAPATMRVEGLPNRGYRVYVYEESRLPAMGDADYNSLESLNTGRIWKPAEKTITLPPRSLVVLR